MSRRRERDRLEKRDEQVRAEAEALAADEVNQAEVAAVPRGLDDVRAW